MTNSIWEFEHSGAVFIIGSNTTEAHPVIGAVVERGRQRGATLIVADPRETEMARRADIHLQQIPGTDVALLNAMMHVIVTEQLIDSEYIAARTDGFDELAAFVTRECPPEGAEQITGVPAGQIAEAARAFAKAGRGAILYSMGITQHTTGVDSVRSIANLAMMTGNVGIYAGGVNPLRGQNNVQGACDMACLPGSLPGYQLVADPGHRAKFEKAWGVELSTRPGLTLTEMTSAAADGRIKAMLIMGENPMVSDPDLNHVREALEALDFLVVQDIFLTETARLADVVLPAAAYAEKDGSVTNTERRVQLLRQAVPPPGESRADWRIISDLLGRLGHPVSYGSPAEIMDEIAGLTPIYGGVSHERLAAGGGLQWPCPDRSHPGTPFLHKERFSRGRGQFAAIPYRPAAEQTDGEYPLILTTGRILYHFHTGTMTRRAAGLHATVPEGFIEVNDEDAAAMGLADGQAVRVVSRRGDIVTAARAVPTVRRGVVFMPFHFAEGAANVLTNTALDPVAKIPELKVCAVRLEPLGEPPGGRGGDER